jgi:hypothetical protein
MSGKGLQVHDGMGQGAEQDRRDDDEAGENTGSEAVGVVASEHGLILRYVCLSVWTVELGPFLCLRGSSYARTLAR